jgi:hypothetical protein
MIKYYLRNDGVYAKVDESNQTITNVMNLNDKKLLAHFTDPGYYKMIVETQITEWNVSDESTYETNKSQVIINLSGI